MLVDSSERFHWCVMLAIYALVTSLLIVIGQAHVGMDVSVLHEKTYFGFLFFTVPGIAPLAGFMVTLILFRFVQQETGDPRWLCPKSTWAKLLLVVSILPLGMLLEGVLPSISV